MKSLVSFIALIWLALADPTMTTKNGYLDPGRITWWQEKWAPNPIELSQTNSGTTDVTINVNFRPSTSVNSASNQGIVQLIVPSAFTSTTSYESNVMIITANSDLTASFSLGTSTLPTAGIYGPFQLITRSSSTGQIYDANYVFGCVAVSASVTISGSTLTTAAATLTATTGIVGSKDALTFTFTVPSGTNLWKHDIFEIIPDSRWTVTASPTCQSVEITSVTNYIKGPNNDNYLPCAVAASGGANGGFNTATSTASPAKNSIYVYGLSQEVINTAGYQVKLQVSSFTFPGSCVSSSSYEWQVKLWRWGTNNLLAGFKGSGPLTPAAGSITVSSWAPYNSALSQSDIPSASAPSIFTKLTFKLSHTVSDGGKIEITFNSNAVINTGVWWQDIGDSSTQAVAKCFLNNYVAGVSCSVSGSVATISLSGDDTTLGSSNEISITLLTTLSSGAKITSIISSDGSNTIDTLSSAQSWTFSSLSSYASLTKFNFVANALDKYYLHTSWATTYKNLQIGADTSKYLVWMVSPSTTWSNTYVLKVYLPFTSSGVSLTKTYIDSSAAYMDDYVTDTSTDDLEFTGSSLAKSSAPTPSAGTPGTISISISGEVLSGKYFGFGLGDGTTSTALPYVKSNVGTFYECWAKVYSTSTASNPVEFSSTVFSVYSSLADTSLTAKPTCTDRLNGIPILVNFHANLMDFNFGDSTNKYMLDVAFDITATSSTNLGSGLTDGSALPIATTSSALTPTATITADTVTISGTGTVTTTNDAVIFLPNGSDTPTNIDATLTFYYVLRSGDPSIQYVLYTGTSSKATVTTTAKALSSATWTSPTDAKYTVGGTSVATSGTATNTADLTITSGDYLVVGLPSGFTASSPSVTLGGILSSTYSASSSSNTFAGGFIVGVASSTGSNIVAGTGAVSYSFGGINAAMSSLSTSTTSSNLNLLILTASGSGSACKASGALAVSINAATITDDNCALDKAYTNGSDSVDSTLTLSFITANDIPGNGKIIITLTSGSWTVSSSAVKTTCYGSGFTDYDTKNGVTSTCTVSGTTVTLTKFAEVKKGTVTVYINHVIPTSTSASSVSVDCFDEVATYDVSGNYIDHVDSLSNSVDLAVTSVVGTTTSTGFVSKVYPSVPGATADVYLSFSFTKAVPAGSIINIKAGFASSLTLSSTNTENYCWTDQYLTSCSVSGTTVSLTIGNSLSIGQAVQVYLDSALTVPSTNITESGWVISTTWNGVTVTDDDTAFFKQVVGPTVSFAFTVASITQVNSVSAGESTSYLFSLSSAAAIATTDTIVVQFPREFDPHVGDAQPYLKDCLPNNYYLTCSSTKLGIASGTYCAADHWYVTVTGISTGAAAATTFDLTINNVRNPVAQTTSGKFSFYQYGSDGFVKSYTQSTQTITIGAGVTNIVTLKNITVDSAELSSATTYNFNFYAANTYTPDNIISIIFPQQFNNQLRMGSTSGCKAVYYDESSSSTSVTTPNTFSSVTSCTVNQNNVTLTFAASSTVTTASTGRINLQLTTFYNPQHGISRSMGWDVSDYSTFSGTVEPVEWSNKFDIVVSQFSTGKTYAKSYGVLNSGYVGYSLSTIDVSVGDYNPNTASSGIKLLPGQQSSDIAISLLDSNEWPLKSKSLILKPFSNKNYPDNGTLKYTSAFYNYKAFQMGTQMNFRVSATSTATSGVYYIDWETPVEVPQDGSTTLYSAPLSILVEVCSSLSPIAVSVDNLPSFYQYYTSIPVRVSLPNAPATELIVTPAASVAGITISPATLKFAPDVTEKYFQVQVGSAYVASTTSPTISYSLSGTDQAAFSAPKSQTATVYTTGFPVTTVVTPGVSSITKVSGNHVKIPVTTTIAGVLYWGLGCQGSDVYSFSGLYDLVSDLVNPSSTIQTLQEQLATEYAATETDIDSTQDADINDFFNRIHQEHCKTYWASSQVISTSGATIDIDWLMAGTSYTFTAYIATRLTNDTTAYPIKTYNFTTDSMGYTYTTSVTFTGTVDASQNATIAKILAKNMGVNPSWLTLSAHSTSRLLQTTTTSTFSFNVLSDSRYSGYTSQDIISNLNKNSAQATSDFTSSSFTVSSLGTSTVVATGTAPTLSPSPTKVSVDQTSAVFSATSTQAGTIYVSCSDTDLSGRITYAWQVRDGLDATATPVSHMYADVVATTAVNITVSGLTAGTSYVCYFTACNNAPQNQLCLDYVSSSSTALPSVSITTLESDDSSAVYMGVGSLLAFLLILLN